VCRLPSSCAFGKVPCFFSASPPSFRGLSSARLASPAQRYPSLMTFFFHGLLCPPNFFFPLLSSAFFFPNRFSFPFESVPGWPRRTFSFIFGPYVTAAPAAIAVSHGNPFKISAFSLIVLVSIFSHLRPPFAYPCSWIHTKYHRHPIFFSSALAQFPSQPLQFYISPPHLPRNSPALPICDSGTFSKSFFVSFIWALLPNALPS